MEYNLSYDIISLIVLIIVGIKFFSQKQFPVLSNRLYGQVILFGIANIILDILGSIFVMNVVSVPVWINIAVNSMYYISLLLVPSALTLYIVALISNKKTVKKQSLNMCIIPSYIALVIFFVGLPLGKIFIIGSD